MQCTGSCACSELYVAVVSQLKISVSLILLSQGTKEMCGSRTLVLWVVSHSEVPTRSLLPKRARNKTGRHGGVNLMRTPESFSLKPTVSYNSLLRHFVRLHRDQYGVSAVSVSRRGSKEAGKLAFFSNRYISFLLSGLEATEPFPFEFGGLFWR